MMAPRHRRILVRTQQKTSSKWKWGFSDKSGWDWLNLLGVLAIPLVLGIATILLGLQQAHLADLQHQSDQNLALDQQRETTLVTCIGDIRDLLLNKGLKTSKPNDEVRVVARAEVLSVLRQLDGERKGLLVRFLSEAGLITDMNRKNDVIIDLSGADLADADLNSTLSFVSSNAFVIADVNNVDLRGADLKGANLTGAQLIAADLRGANLTYADLKNADLRSADLTGAQLIAADLEGTQLHGAVMPNGSIHP